MNLIFLKAEVDYTQGDSNALWNNGNDSIVHSTTQRLITHGIMLYHVKQKLCVKAKTEKELQV